MLYMYSTLYLISKLYILKAHHYFICKPFTSLFGPVFLQKNTHLNRVRKDNKVIKYVLYYFLFKQGNTTAQSARGTKAKHAYIHCVISDLCRQLQVMTNEVSTMCHNLVTTNII